MKANRIYIIGILVFLAITFIIELSLPKKFVWKATFSQYDHQPFGSAVFDDVVLSSLPDPDPSDTLPAYSVTHKTFYQLSQDSLVNYSILFAAEHLALNEVDREALLKMLDRGNKIVLVASSFDYQLTDTLCFDYAYSYFSLKRLKSYVSSSQERDTLYWPADSLFRNERIFRVFPHLCEGYFYNTDSLYTALCMKKYQEYDDSLETVIDKYAPCVVMRSYGKGSLTLVSTPLLFTNYGMLDEDNSDYIFRALNQLKGLPVLRMEAYGEYMQEYEETPFRYLLSQAPLRWGLFLTMITIVLFIIFTARREQRVIQVIRRPVNKTIEFVQLIGTLYFQRKDHTGLVGKKFIYFAETLRRMIQVDVEGGENDVELAHWIALKTGVKEEEVYRLLVNIRPVIRGERQVNEVNMKRFIDDMNTIINHI